MSMVPQRLYTAGQVRELDRIAIEDCGIEGYALMQRAGLAAFRWLRYCFPRATRLAVYCGGGNNGGDGYVLAALAARAGLDVQVVAVGEAKSAAARRARRDFERAGGALSGEHDPSRSDVIVDALLGTGLQRAPAGAYGDVVRRLNAAAVPTLAMDIPSGLHADTGEALEPCVRADTTVTFIGRKLGCFTAAGRARAGRIYFDELGVPPAIYERVEHAASLIAPGGHAAFIGARSASAHKGDAGRLLVVGGNHGMPGAPCLSARAAHRGGAGLVYLASRSRPAELVSNSLESMAVEIQAAEDLDPVMEKADVIAVGPGLGRDAWAREAWRRVLQSGKPLVVDADALYQLADTQTRRDDWVLTPHPGEAARMLNISTGAVQRDRLKACRDLQARHGGVVVLKGPGTLVRGRALHVCDRGNAGMASAGMGDVLTGVIAALLGQGLGAEAAACYGTWCHAEAGDRAARRGLVGVTASDVIEALQGVVGALPETGAGDRCWSA